jgi:hypothetical protein
LDKRSENNGVMNNLLAKLNYKGQNRIAVINADDNFTLAIRHDIMDVQTDSEIDPRYPYEFMILFVTNSPEVEQLAPKALHNLVADGVLWFCYPKKTSEKYNPGLDRDHGWKVLNDSGLFGIRIVSIDETWSALRFRNKKFIKSASERFQ